MALAESGRYADAIELFEQALADDPRNPDILYNLGMCFTETDRPDRAVTALTRSIEHNPNHANSYVALGYACFRLDDVDKAITHLRHALSLDPDNPYALRNLGGLCGKLGPSVGSCERFVHRTPVQLIVRASATGVCRRLTGGGYASSPLSHDCSTRILLVAEKMYSCYHRPHLPANRRTTT